MKDNHNSTASKRANEGADTSHAKAGYADTIISNVNKISSGLRPIRSDAAPITGSQNRLDMPTHIVTIRLSMLLSLSTSRPNVGVSAVMKENVTVVIVTSS